MAGLPVYRSGLTDSSRWIGFPLRPGDVVLSVPSKCGTTWVQMICALLIFQDPELPAPLTTLSPWLDMRLRPIDEVRARLERQDHRRFIKTHTPLDGLPTADGVMYVVVGRHPLDAAVSLEHHRANMNRAAVERLIEDCDDPPRSGTPRSGWRQVRQGSLRDRVLAWIEDDRTPTEQLHSLRGLCAHLAGAWDRRRDDHVVLLHHAELSRDLEGGMRRLAARLGITVPEDRWPLLVRSAGFRAMQARAGDLAPDERLGLFTDSATFFRSARAGQWSDVLSAADVRAYEARLSELVPADLAAWLPEGGHL